MSATPVPVSVAVAGLSRVAAATLRVADAAPSAVGWKTTRTVQALATPSSRPPHPSLMTAKLGACAPEMVAPPRSRVVLPVLRSVRSVAGEASASTGMAPRSAPDGTNAAPSRASPTPLTSVSPVTRAGSEFAPSMSARPIVPPVLLLQ